MEFDEQIERFEIVEFLQNDDIEDRFMIVEKMKIKEGSTPIFVCRINVESQLFRCLKKWFDNSTLALCCTVRSCVFKQPFLYFTTGAGYDWFSVDLLGGRADGRAKRCFLKFCEYM